MAYDDDNKLRVDFDLDSILSEFGALDEEPLSEMPLFEPKMPVRDSSQDDTVFSAEIGSKDEHFAAPGLDRAAVLAEFNSDDSISAARKSIDIRDVRREFMADDKPDSPKARSKAAVPPKAPAPSADYPVFDSATDDIDKIIAEFRQSEKSGGKIIEPEPLPEDKQEFVPEPTRSASPAEPVSDADEASHEPSAEPTQVRSEAVGSVGVESDAVEDELYEGSGLYDGQNEDYAADADYTPVQDAPPHPERPRRQAKNFGEAVTAPFISALAFVTMRIKQSQITLSSAAYEAEDLGEEMPADKAARFYGKHIADLRVRTRIALLLCALMIYITYGLPLPGAMADAGVKSAVCLIMMIAVMFCGLDIITTGIMSLVRLKIHASSLIALSCIFCMADGFLSAAGIGGKNVPYCVIPALTIAFTLLGCTANARSCRMIFNVTAASKTPYILTAESPITENDITLVKGRRTADGIVRRTEEDGPDESVFGVLTPYFVIAALIFSIAAAAVTKSFTAFAHILAGIFVCAAPVSMLLSYPLPFFISAKSLIRSGCAIAGWSGLYDIGKAKHLIITDTDLFPKGSVRISKTRIFSGMEASRVISFAASIISASGSSMVHPFSELMKKADGTLMTVEAFSVHESGGLTAMVDGETVYCGNPAFMRLMGVALPEKYVLNNGVYIAVAGIICGVFEMEYTASDAVKQALEELMSSSRHAVFAVRDFNITPSMLSVKFDMPTDGFDFPPYSERYTISASEPGEDSKPSALISREGLRPLVSLADHARALFGIVNLCVILSAASAIIGIVLMFILTLSAAASASTVLSYMLVWLVLTIILSFSISTP